MQFEEVVQLLGEFGLYQRLLYAISCFAAITSALHSMVGLYALNAPAHRCRIPELGAADAWGANASTVRQFVPPAPCRAGGCFDSCRLYGNGTNGTVPCSDGWVYDTSEFVQTFATENNLVCSTQLQLLLTTTTQSFYFGQLAGSFFVGFLADLIGRRPVLIACMLAQAAAGVASGCLSGVPAFWAARFIGGVASSGVFPTAFVLGIEFIGPSMRLHAGFVIEYVFALSLVALALGASLLRHWRWLVLAQSSISLLSIFMLCLLPESPRWLLAVGRCEEAEQIIRRAARVNKVQLPDDLRLEPPQLQQEQQDSKSKESCLSIARYPRVLCLCVNIVFHWFVVSVVYLGLSYNAAALPGDIYFTSGLNAAAEALGYGMAHVCLRFFGRKWPHLASMLACSLLLGSTVLLELLDADLSWLFLTLALLGKMTISAAFAIVYLWSAEMAATSLRQTVVGVANVSSRIGSSLGPFVTDLGRLANTPLKESLSLLLFAALAAAAGASTLLLPETRGRRLPETLHDADELVRTVRIGCCMSRRVAPAAEEPQQQKDCSQQQQQNAQKDCCQQQQQQQQNDCSQQQQQGACA